MVTDLHCRQRTLPGGTLYDVGRWLDDDAEPDSPWRWESWGAGPTEDAAWHDAGKRGAVRPTGQRELFAN